VLTANGYQINTFVVDRDALYLAQLGEPRWTQIPPQLVHALLRAGAIVKEHRRGKSWTVINNACGDELIKLPAP
jgi:hypothetical protein